MEDDNKLKYFFLQECFLLMNFSLIFIHMDEEVAPKMPRLPDSFHTLFLSLNDQNAKLISP